MNITPERMLELIELIEERATLFENFFGDMTQETVVKYREISACLKSYAEILPKCQAVLDAEVVGEIHHGRSAHIDWTEDPEELEAGSLLIIKPSP